MVRCHGSSTFAWRVLLLALERPNPGENTSAPPPVSGRPEILFSGPASPGVWRYFAAADLNFPALFFVPLPSRDRSKDSYRRPSSFHSAWGRSAPFVSKCHADANPSVSFRRKRNSPVLLEFQGVGIHRWFLCCAPAFTMVLGSNICIQKTLYDVLSVTEDATYDEIRASYKSAALNTHPDRVPESSAPSHEQPEFLSVQKAWETLRHPNSRAEYDKQLQSSRQNIEIIASEIEVEDMVVERSYCRAADTVELLYPYRCGDYFSITSCELGEMGILITEAGEVELQTPDSVSASIVLGCGSCSLKIRLLINKTS